MLPERFVAAVRRLTAALMAQTLGRTALTASVLTILSPILMIGAVWLLVEGRFIWAGALILFASSFDVFDGALARAKNEASRIGAFLDSTLDRYSEVLIFIGLLMYYQRTAPASVEIFLIFLSTTGSLLVSYIRARAESLEYDCRVGLLERPERIILIVVGLLTGWMTFILWILAILTHVTAVQRFIHVWAQSRTTDGRERAISAMRHGK